MHFDPEQDDKGTSSFMVIFAGMVIASWLLGLSEGTLVWIALESLEDIGVIDQHVPWWPIVTIVVALNMIRFLDRGFRSFSKPS